MSIIFFLSAQQRISVAESTVINFIFFKSLHLIEYAILMILWVVPLSRLYSSRTASYIALGCTLLYAISDELHQQFVPTRNGAVRDVIIDGLGAGIGWILIRFIPKNWLKLLT